MYVSGTQHNFKNRLHQFAKNEADLTDFALEAATYTEITLLEKQKLNREAQKLVPSFDLFEGG